MEGAPPVAGGSPKPRGSRIRRGQVEENLTNRGRIRRGRSGNGMGGKGEGMENLFLEEWRFALISPQLEGNMTTSKHGGNKRRYYDALDCG